MAAVLICQVCGLDIRVGMGCTYASMYVRGTGRWIRRSHRSLYSPDWRQAGCSSHHPRHKCCPSSA